MLDILKTILLGIVEGITEWLPISSTGHMILIDEFVSLNVSEEFKELFLVVIQLGAILAVVLLFWKKIWPFHTKSAEIKPYFKENTAVKRLCYNYVHIDKIILWIKILIASVPAAILGVLFDDEIDAMLTGDGRAYVVSATLIIYGILFIVIESISKKEKHADLDKLPYTTAFFIGLIQCLALIPGTSRSGSTILGAMLLGATRTVSTEFSFFLSIPAMFGASAIKILKYFLDGNSFNSDELIILVVGMIVAFVVSVLAIKFLVSYIKKHNFKAFGYYRIVLGIIVLAYFLFV
ncbi:MAG: undecaprenyl-diphosphate phosphatase [Ruminococcaceae bacterium]|nr:undecaprenyl-diphosphate phosphatase [Oscillospiraceae bacterium]